jgi:putative ABC transport system substrate-binding protein
MIDRRRFVGVATCALVVPWSTARAQPKQTARQIAWLTPTDPSPPAETRQFWLPARKLGWIEGENLLITFRYASGRMELLPALAQELVRLKPEVIVTEGTDATLAAKGATSSIPIIFDGAADPVGSGLVASLARPGSNVTGLSLVSPETDAKRLSLLRELLPGAQRIGELINPENTFIRKSQAENERSYRSLGLSPIFIEVAAAGELEKAVAEAARRGAQALVIRADLWSIAKDDAVMRAAIKHALPTVVGGRDLLEAGALLSYNLDEEDHAGRLFRLLDKVLRGAKPADLPVEQPTKFELAINLRTARQLGLTIPRSLLVRADHVVK